MDQRSSMSHSSQHPLFQSIDDPVSGERTQAPPDAFSSLPLEHTSHSHSNSHSAKYPPTYGQQNLSDSDNEHTAYAIGGGSGFTGAGGAQPGAHNGGGGPRAPGRVANFFAAYNTPNQIAFLSLLMLQTVAILTMIGLIYGTVNGATGNISFQANFEAAPKLETVATYLALFIVAELFELLVALDSLMQKNIVELALLLPFQLAMLVYSAVLPSQLHAAIYQTNADTVSVQDRVRAYAIVIPCIIGAISVVMSWMVARLYAEFGWAVFKRIGADIGLKKMYTMYQIFVCLLKFDLFFIMCASFPSRRPLSIPTHFSVQFLVLVTSTPTAEKVITIIAVPVILACLVLAAVAVRWESRAGVYAFFVLDAAGMTYFIYKLVRIFDPSSGDRYSTAKKTLTIFSVISFLMLLITFDSCGCPSTNGGCACKECGSGDLGNCSCNKTTGCACSASGASCCCPKGTCSCASCSCKEEDKVAPSTSAATKSIGCPKGANCSCGVTCGCGLRACASEFQVLARTQSLFTRNATPTAETQLARATTHPSLRASPLRLLHSGGRQTMAIRAGVLARLGLVTFAVVFVLHFLATTLSPREEYEEDDPNWSERLGLDHYADWEAGVAGRLGNGMDKVRDGLGVIKGGLGWGLTGTKLGSLYELVQTSNPSPRAAYFDERTSLDRLRLSSTRVLGHGPTDSEDVDDDHPTLYAGAANRRHILVTGGFGSLGKHVVRDLLLGLSGHKGRSQDVDEWSAIASKSDEEDILITLLDVRDRAGELNHLLQSAPIVTTTKVKGTDPRAQAFTSSERTVSSFKRRGKLRTILGDVRDKDLLKQLLAPSATTELASQSGPQGGRQGAGFRRPTKLKNHVDNEVTIPPVSGVIHLAAYSPSACRLNPVDCADVEIEGMRNIIAALGREGFERTASNGEKAVIADRPWVVVSRRGEAWAEIPDSWNANSSMASTPAAYEQLKEFAVGRPVHSLILQLPSSHSIIGDPYAPRFDPIPHIVESALGDLPVQVYTLADNMHDSFLSIDDAAQSIIQGARMLELASKKLYLRALAFVAELEVVGPGIIIKSDAGPLAELAKATIALTRSYSPFAEIIEGTQTNPAESALRAQEKVAMRKTLSRVLGFSPTITIRAALKTYILSLLTLQSSYLIKQVNVACSSAPSVPVLEEGLLGLSGCNVQLLTVIEGAYFTLGCSEGLEGPHDVPLALVGAIPFKEGVRGVEVLAERGMEGKVDLQLRCPTTKDGKMTGDSDVVVWADTTDGGEFEEAMKAGQRTIAEWYTVDFSNRESRSFTLTLPPTEGIAEGQEPKRRLTLKDLRGDYKSLIFQAAAPGEGRPMQWRINPICCASNERRKELWDFFKEDPVITSQVTFPSEDGRTSLQDSTLSAQRCKSLRKEHDRIVKLRTYLKQPAASATCYPNRGEASQWEAKDLQTCQIDCAAPLACLSSETCKCTRDRCGDRRAGGPFPAVAYSDRKSFSPAPVEPPKPLTLKERVAIIPWESIILPGARRAFATPLADLPQANVVDLPDTIDTHMQSPACYDLDKSPLPFLGDHFFVEDLRNRSVAIEDADFVMVPYFQGCYYNYLQENTFKKLADTVGFAETRIAAAEQITASKIAIPFTHDFGSCTGWWPRLEDVLGRSPPSPMDQAVAWQVNGDYNTRCVKPDRDVVVPAVSKHTKALIKTFGDLDAVEPSVSRKHLAFFAGGVRGFGAVARTRIGCGRTSQEVATSSVLYQQFAEGERYLGTLNQAKFCLIPRGIPAWSTRAFEAIYAGCIPAFVVDRNIFPFQDVLDYSLFSVSIPENDAHRVEEFLAVYTDAQLSQLQAHVLRVREAFLFKEGEEWERKGPLFFSLVSMAMRLYLGYPEVSTCSDR
ncbi:hypothetical protein RQP46_004144 [Phenoliferia psychrophenolica]